MYREMCRCKIRGARVTDKNLRYEGSITIDKAVLKKAGILVGEMVHVLNLNNGARIATYTIEGEENSGVMCLNGPAARQFETGDEIIILGISIVEDGEDLRNWQINLIDLDENNRIKLE